MCWGVSPIFGQLQTACSCQGWFDGAHQCVGLSARLRVRRKNSSRNSAGWTTAVVAWWISPTGWRHQGADHGSSWESMDHFPWYFHQNNPDFPSELHHYHHWPWRSACSKVMMKVFSHRYDIITTAVLGQLSQNWKLAHQVHYAPSSALLSICVYLFVPASSAFPGIHLNNLQLQSWGQVFASIPNSRQSRRRLSD